MNPENRHARIPRAACQAGVIAALFLQFDCVTAQSAIPLSPGLTELSPSDLQIEISDDLVTLLAHDVRVRDILDELAFRTALAFISYGSLEERLTLEVDRLPLDEVLRHVLRGRSFLLYQPQTTSPHARGGEPERVSRLWIFSNGLHAARSSDSTTSRIESLERRLMSGDLSTRREAVKSARTLDGDEALAPLSLALADEDKTVRAKAIYGLANMGGDQAAGALAAALGDENPGIREEAAYALGVVGSDTAVQYLRHALHDTDRGVREVAIRALAEAGGEASTSALATVMRDPDASLREEAARALGETGGDSAARVLREALEDQDAVVRQAAKEALTDLSSQEP